MKKNKIVIVAFLSLFLAACFSDEGNYTYNQINDLVIGSKNGVNVVIAGGEVVIEPTVKFSLAAADDPRPIPEVTYEWGIDNNVLSKDKTFTYKAGNELGIIFGYLKVTNVATGEQYATRIKISVEPAYKTGYAILHENEAGVGELGFIRTITNSKKIEWDNYDTLIYTGEYANIYELANGHPMLKNPVSITEFSASSINSGDILTALTLVSDNGDFIENLNGGTLARETKLQDEFVDELLPDGFSPKQVVDTPWDSYLIAKNGLMYTKRGSNREQLFTGRYNARFTYNDDTKYSDIISTYACKANILLAIEYDKDNKRSYVGIVCEDRTNPINNGMRLPFSAGTNTELLKHFQDVKYEILASDYLQNGYYIENSVAQSLLVKEKEKYFLHVMVLSYNSQSSVSVNESVKIDLSTITGGKAVLGMSTSKIKDNIMFYDENNIYIYDWALKTTTTLFTSTKKICAVGQLARVRNYHGYTDKQSVNPSFAVGYETGEVEIYELEKPNLKTVSKNVYKSTNKFGKIKQIVYKLGISGEFFDEV